MPLSRIALQWRLFWARTADYANRRSVPKVETEVAEYDSSASAEMGHAAYRLHGRLYNADGSSISESEVQRRNRSINETMGELRTMHNKSLDEIRASLAKDHKKATKQLLDYIQGIQLAYEHLETERAIQVRKLGWFAKHVFCVRKRLARLVAP